MSGPAALLLRSSACFGHAELVSRVAAGPLGLPARTVSTVERVMTDVALWLADQAVVAAKEAGTVLPATLGAENARARGWKLRLAQEEV